MPLYMCAGTSRRVARDRLEQLARHISGARNKAPLQHLQHLHHLHQKAFSQRRRHACARYACLQHDSRRDGGQALQHDSRRDARAHRALRFRSAPCSVRTSGKLNPPKGLLNVCIQRCRILVYLRAHLRYLLSRLTYVCMYVCMYVCIMYLCIQST